MPSNVKQFENQHILDFNSKEFNHREQREKVSDETVSAIDHWVISKYGQKRKHQTTIGTAVPKKCSDRLAQTKPKILNIIKIRTTSPFDLWTVSHETSHNWIVKLFFIFFFNFKLETAMNSCKVLLAAIFVVTLSSLAHAAPLNSPPNRVYILINLGLSPKLTNATEEVRDATIFQCKFYSVSSQRNNLFM